MKKLDREFILKTWNFPQKNEKKFDFRREIISFFFFSIFFFSRFLFSQFVLFHLSLLPVQRYQLFFAEITCQSWKLFSSLTSSITAGEIPPVEKYNINRDHFFFFSVSELFSETIFLAFQLRQIQETNLHSRIFKSAIRNLIDGIILFYPNPISKPAANVNTTILELRTRSSKKNHKSKTTFTKTIDHFESFLEIWAVDGSLIFVAVKKFFESFIEFRKSLTFKTVVHRYDDKTSTESTSERNTSLVIFFSPGPNREEKFTLEKIPNRNDQNNNQNEKPEFIFVSFDVSSFENLIQKNPSFDVNVSHKNIPSQRKVGNTSFRKKIGRFSNSEELKRFFLKKDPIILIRTSEVLNLIEKKFESIAEFPLHVKQSLILLIDFFRQNFHTRLPITFSTVIRLPRTFPEKNEKDVELNNKQQENQISTVNILFPSIIFQLGVLSADVNSKANFSAVFQAKIADSSINHSRDQLRKDFRVQFAFFLINILEFPKLNFSFWFFFFFIFFQPVFLNRLSWSSKGFFSTSNPTLASHSKHQPIWTGGSRIEKLRNSSENQNLRHQKSKKIEILISDQKHSRIHQNSSGPNIMKNTNDDANPEPASGPSLGRMSKEKMRQKMRKLIIAMFETFAKNVKDRIFLVSQTAVTASGSHFKISDVDFFDSKLNEFYETDDVVQIDRDIYYRNVYFFVKRIRDTITIVETEKIKSNFSNCFRKSIQIWYTKRFFDLKKEALRSLKKKAERWCDALIKKFKRSISSALQVLITKRYILKNVRNQKNIFSFVFQIMKHVKKTNINDLHDQLTWIYNAIAPELVRDVDPFEKNITIINFINKLESKKEIWYRIYSRKYGFNYKTGAGNQQNQYYFRRSEYQETYDKSQQNTYLFSSTPRRLLQAPEENVSKKNHLNPFQQNAEKDRKGKTSAVISFWKDRFFLKDFNSGERNFDFQKNRGGYLPSKDRGYDTIRSRSNYQRQNKFQDYYRNQKNYNLRFQKIHMTTEEFEDSYVGKTEVDDSRKRESDEFYEDIDPSQKNDGGSFNDQYFYNLSSEFFEVCKKCEIFKKKFFFNNVFHHHIRGCIQIFFTKVSSTTETERTQIENRLVIKFTTFIIIGNGLAFRSYSYATIWIMISMQKFVETIVDSKCFVFFINEFYLRSILPHEKTILMTAPMNVKGIGNAVNEFINYVVLNIYLNELSKKKLARKHIHRKFHFVKKLKCKIFLKMSFFAAEQIIINIVDKIMIIPICETLIVFIKIALKPNSRVRRVIHAKNQTFISVKSVARIPTYMKKKKIPDDKNYLFEFDRKQFTVILKKFEEFYSHVCDGNMSCVQVRNDRNITVNISRRARLDMLTEYEEKGCYQIDDEYHDAAVVTNTDKLNAWKLNSNVENFYQIIRET